MNEERPRTCSYPQMNISAVFLLTVLSDQFHRFPDVIEINSRDFKREREYLHGVDAFIKPLNLFVILTDCQGDMQERRSLCAKLLFQILSHFLKAFRRLHIQIQHQTVLFRTL